MSMILFIFEKYILCNITISGVEQYAIWININNTIDIYLLLVYYTDRKAKEVIPMI